jgi:hypothetical protein
MLKSEEPLNIMFSNSSQENCWLSDAGRVIGQRVIRSCPRRPSIPAPGRKKRKLPGASDVNASPTKFIHYAATLRATSLPIHRAPSGKQAKQYSRGRPREYSSSKSLLHRLHVLRSRLANRLF